MLGFAYYQSWLKSYPLFCTSPFIQFLHNHSDQDPRFYSGPYGSCYRFLAAKKRGGS